MVAVADLLKVDAHSNQKGWLACQVRAEATSAARRELDAQTKSVEKGREDIRALQDRLAQAQQDSTRQSHLLAVQAAENDQRAAKLAKQEVVLPSLITHCYLLGIMIWGL